MNVKHIFQQGLKSGLVAVFIAWPIAGWSAPVADRPLFIDAAVDHNLMFVIDDSGSMDHEVTAPAVGVADGITRGYVFNPGRKYYYTDGRRVSGVTFWDFSEEYYYLRSAEYNLQYYDPSTEYNPWPSGTTRTYENSDITSAKLDPGLSGSLSYDLTTANTLGLGSGNVPATFFVKNDAATVTVEELKYCQDGYYRDNYYGAWVCWNEDGPGGYYAPDDPIEVNNTTDQCSDPSVNWYDKWTEATGNFEFTDADGNAIAQGQMGIGPDGDCLQRVELTSGNDAEVLATTGQSLAVQQQNFANWFSYYRRRHQAIRGAVGESVADLENMRLGVFWINENSPSVTMYDSDTSRGEFLDKNYERFVDGTYFEQGTPNREALDRAGQQYGKTSVRGTLECRRNFTLLFTDGYSSNPGRSWIRNFGNQDKEAVAPFANSKYSGTLGDVAYYYNQNLRDSSGNAITGGAMRVPSECGTGTEEAWMDCNKDFHMNTYTISLGMTGQNFAGLGYSSVKDAHDSPPDWGSSDMDTYNFAYAPQQIDDLYHAAVNGKGEYYNARSTTALVKSLQSAVDDVQEQLGSGSNVSFNTTSLKNGGYVYSAQFTSQSWTGTLRAEAIDKDGVVSSRKWDAAIKLDARDLDVNPRLILTNKNGTGVEFAWDNLTTTQQNDLKGGGAGNAALGQARLSYIQGVDVAGAEGEIFRERKSRLGAIVNSSPVFVGEPNRIWPDKTMFGATPYSAFKANSAYKNRAEVVYVGANDGMLHGFDADTGEEILAYIPAFLFSETDGKGLGALTNPDLDYQSYVDLPLNTSDVYVNGAWRSIVVGGSRGATPGIFALDVTDPTQFTKDSADKIVMWEFSGNNNLGNLTEAVQISLLKWGDSDYRWSAVFSNGYGAPSGKNGLFVVDIADPSNYEFIELATGGGLSPVRMADFKDVNGDPNSDGVADRAYAGDLEGRLWAIDLSGGRSNWAAAYSGSPLFVAKNSQGNTQPITAQPDIARNSYKKDLNDPNLLVFFGTGKYLVASDIPGASDTPPVQSFYGISDQGTSVDSNGNRLSRDDLSERSVTTGSVTVDGVSVPVRKTDGAPLDWGTDYGWYLDLPSSGERVVEGATVRGDYVVFPSTIPSVGDPCGGGGSSFLTALELDGSTDSSKAIIDVNRDGKLDGDDEGWAGVFYGDGIVNNIALIDNILIASDSGAKKTPFLTDFGAGQNQSKRIGWHEIMAP